MRKIKVPKIVPPIVNKYIFQRGGTLVTIESTLPPDLPLHMNVFLVPLIQYMHNNGWAHVT
jgi:hypothetical protein